MRVTALTAFCVGGAEMVVLGDIYEPESPGGAVLFLIGVLLGFVLLVLVLARAQLLPGRRRNPAEKVLLAPPKTLSLARIANLSPHERAFSPAKRRASRDTDRSTCHRRSHRRPRVLLARR